MPVNLRCDCGHEIQLQDDEAKELTWCPRCHKVLVQPPALTAPEPITRNRAPSGGGGGGAGGRVAGILAMFVIMALVRGACRTTQTYTEPRYEYRNVPAPVAPALPKGWMNDPRFQRPPNQGDPLLPRDDDQLRPGKNRNPFGDGRPPDRPDDP